MGRAPLAVEQGTRRRPRRSKLRVQRRRSQLRAVQSPVPPWAPESRFREVPLRTNPSIYAVVRHLCSSYGILPHVTTITFRVTLLVAPSLTLRVFREVLLFGLSFARGEYTLGRALKTNYFLMQNTRTVLHSYTSQSHA